MDEIGSISIRYDNLDAFLEYAGETIKFFVANDRINPELQEFVNSLVSLSSEIDCLVNSVPDYLKEYKELQKKRESIEKAMALQEEARASIERELAKYTKAGDHLSKITTFEEDEDIPTFDDNSIALDVDLQKDITEAAATDINVENENSIEEVAESENNNNSMIAANLFDNFDAVESAPDDEQEYESVDSVFENDNVASEQEHEEESDAENPITPMSLFNSAPRSAASEEKTDNLNAFSFDNGTVESLYSDSYISSVDINCDSGYAPPPPPQEEEKQEEEDKTAALLQIPSEFDDSIDDEEFILGGGGMTMSIEHDIHGDDPDLFQDISGYNPYTKITENADVDDPEFVFSENESLENLIGSPSGSALPEIMFPGDDLVDEIEDEELNDISKAMGLGGNSEEAFDKLASNIDPEYNEDKMNMLISGIF